MWNSCTSFLLIKVSGDGSLGNTFCVIGVGIIQNAEGQSWQGIVRELSVGS